MFFIAGFTNGSRKLDFDQLEICSSCGQYGHVEVYVTYLCLTLFFLPILKWNKRYYVKMSCCRASCEISKELGKAIEHGSVTHLSMDQLPFKQQENGMKRCSTCGFTTVDDFQYCPKCGRKL